MSVLWANDDEPSISGSIDAWLDRGFNAALALALGLGLLGILGWGLLWLS